MNQKYLKIIGTVCSCIILAGCSNKNNNIETVQVNPDDYVGTFSSVRPTVEITKEATNTYEIKVSWGSSAYETTIWDYECNYDEDNNNMDCVGSKTNYVSSSEDDSQVEEVVYKDGKATFTLKDDILTWDDAKEDSGADIEFTKE